MTCALPAVNELVVVFPITFAEANVVAPAFNVLLIVVGAFAVNALPVINTEFPVLPILVALPTAVEPVLIFAPPLMMVVPAFKEPVVVLPVTFADANVEAPAFNVPATTVLPAFNVPVVVF